MSVRSEVIRIFNELLAGSKKITGLPAATTPLSGTELVEVVQDGENRKVASSALGGGGGGSQNLQQVLDIGSTATITAQLIVNSESGAAFIASDGSVNTSLIGTTAEARVEFNDGTHLGRLLMDASGNLFAGKLVFSPTATIAGLNTGSVAGNPSSLADGDVWYDSSANQLKARINGVTVSLAGLASPAFTGTPTAPTAAGGTNSTQIATTAFVQQEIGAVNGITKIYAQQNFK